MGAWDRSTVLGMNSCSCNGNPAHLNNVQLGRFGRNRTNVWNYNICTDPQYGFKEYHATTIDNPMLPKLLVGETLVAWKQGRQKFIDDLKKDNGW